MKDINNTFGMPRTLRCLQAAKNTNTQILKLHLTDNISNRPNAKFLNPSELITFHAHAQPTNNVEAIKCHFYIKIKDPCYIQIGSVDPAASR